MMKIYFGAVMAMVVCFSLIASAQFEGPSGGTAVTTVKALRGEVETGPSSGGLGGLLDFGIKVAKVEDKKFTLEGNILEKRGRNLYLFKDDTGRMGVEIRNSQFGGVKVTPESRIRLTGEVDYEDGYLIMDVDKIEVVK